MDSKKHKLDYSDWEATVSDIIERTDVHDSPMEFLYLQSKLMNSTRTHGASDVEMSMFTYSEVVSMSNKKLKELKPETLAVLCEELNFIAPDNEEPRKYSVRITVTDDKGVLDVCSVSDLTGNEALKRFSRAKEEIII
jgi:hypothetical protein